MAPETPATTLREPRGGGARPGNGELRGVRGRVFVNRGRAMSRIERVSYRSGFVKRLRESRHLPAITFEAADLPEDVVALVDAHLLDLGGSYGDPEAGDPIQSDELRIEHDQGAVEIVVYHRAIPCGGVRPRSAGGSCAIPRATSRRSCRNRGSQLRATTSG